MSESNLAVVEQRSIQFYDDEIVAVRVEDGGIYVPVRPICDLIGVAWQGQNERISRDLVLSQFVRSVSVTLTEPNRTRNIEMRCLPLDMLNGWLFGINASRVKEAIRPKLIQYQIDCYRVLSEAFLHDQITHRPDKVIDNLLDGDSPAAQAYKMARAVMQMARQQLILEAKLDDHIVETRSDIQLLDARLQTLESDSSKAVSHKVDEAQASRISQAVKAIAFELGQRSRRNEFGGVYGELYRRFDITSYKMLPASKFDEAMNFLTGWYQSLTDGEVPF